MAPIVHFLETYLWPDAAFAVALAMLVACEGVLRSIRLWQQKRFSSSALHDSLVKVAAYCATLLTVHAVTAYFQSHQPQGAFVAILDYFDATVYAAIVLRELLAVHAELTALGYPLLPAKVLSHLAEPANDPAPSTDAELPPGSGAEGTAGIQTRRGTPTSSSSPFTHD